MTIAEIVDAIRAEAEKRPDAVAAAEGSFQFVLTGEDGGTFYARVRDGRAEVNEGRVENPSVTVTVGMGDFADIVSGRLNAAGAFMQGKLKVEGDIGLALRLQSLLG